MSSISITTFRREVFTLVPEVEETGREITITVAGRPAVRIVPYKAPVIQCTHGLRVAGNEVEMVDLTTGEVAGSFGDLDPPHPARSSKP